MSGDLEDQLKQAREQGQLQAARSEVTTLQECVERQRQQLEALQKALDAAKAESKTQQAEVERLSLLEIELRGGIDTAHAAQARARQLQELLDEAGLSAELERSSALERERALELELRQARRLLHEARRNSRAEPPTDADASSEEAWQRQMETLCVGGGSQALLKSQTAMHLRAELAEPENPNGLPSRPGTLRSDKLLGPRRSPTPAPRPLLFPVALLRAELEALQGSSGRSRFDDGGWEAAAAGGGSGSGGADARSQAAWLMGTPSTKGARLAAAAQGDDARRANERRQSVLRRHQIDAEAHAAHTKARKAALAAERAKAVQQGLFEEEQRRSSSAAVAKERLRRSRSTTLPTADRYAPPDARQMGGKLWADVGPLEYRMSNTLLEQMRSKARGPAPRRKAP